MARGPGRLPGRIPVNISGRCPVSIHRQRKTCPADFERNCIADAVSDRLRVWPVRRLSPMENGPLDGTVWSCACSDHSLSGRMKINLEVVMLLLLVVVAPACSRAQAAPAPHPDTTP